jgi:hypothetical protein
LRPVFNCSLLLALSTFLGFWASGESILRSVIP